MTELQPLFNEIAIASYDCFRCGSMENLTRHHAIPKRMNPRKNMTVPLCRKCHNELNTIDNHNVVLLNLVRKGIRNLRYMEEVMENDKKRDILL